MHKLHRILKQINKELETAEDYIHCASHTEDDVQELYKNLARDELSHADKLTNMCEKHIEPDLKAIWEFEKEGIKERLTHYRTKMANID